MADQRAVSLRKANSAAAAATEEDALHEYTLYRRISATRCGAVRPYADLAAKYHEAGFAPIPARGKRVTKNQHHGRGKPWVTSDEVSKWSSLHPDANIALRLPRDIIGIDVDAYGVKPGEATLDELEDELGALPPTVVSTARRDGVSGIRLFRIPDQYWSVIWPGKAGPGIEIIWMGNRYIIAWPSIHPDTGDRYSWLKQDPDYEMEAADELIPDLSILPFLPLDWCDRFARTAQADSLGDVADSAGWIKSHGAGDMCPQMADDVAIAQQSMPDNAHDSARDGTLAVAKDCAAGHTGAAKAMAMLFSEFMSEMGGRSVSRRTGAKAEWQRHFKGAVARGAGILGDGVRPSDPCLEMKDFADGVRLVRNADNILWADDVPEVNVNWLQKPIFPFGSLVIIDGDPGQGKSLITNMAVANAVRGEPIFPFGEHCGRPVNCGLIGAEDELAIVVGRLRASGWNRSDHGRMVAFMKLKRRRGKIEQLTFPHGVERVRSFIVNGGLELVFIDPISSFLGEDVKSHVDASVRTALGPLVEVAQSTGCCIVLIRHMNKQGQMKAMYRGGGSIAFSAMARSGLITGEMQDGRFGLAQVKCSYAKKMPVTLAYSVNEWSEDSSIPVIEWHGEADISADELVAGPSAKRGPEPIAQDEVREILEHMFDESDTWKAKEISDALRQNGYRVDNSAVKKVKREMGIRSGPPRSVGVVGESHWVWTTNPAKITGSARWATDES